MASAVTTTARQRIVASAIVPVRGRGVRKAIVPAGAKQAGLEALQLDSRGVGLAFVKCLSKL
jgi:hypothetical protein